MNEIDIIPVLMREPDSKASIQMNKKLQNAKCFEGNAEGIRGQQLRSLITEVTFKLRPGFTRSQLCENLKENVRDEIILWRSG